MDSSSPEQNINSSREPEGSSKRNRSSETVTAKKTRSQVWEHFTRTTADNDKCECNYCNKCLACPTSSGTSSLKKHLLACKQYEVWEKSGDRQQALTDDMKLKLARVPESVFRKATNELMVMAELPLSFVESMAWRVFCNKVNLYQPHSRRTGTRDIVKMYAEKKAAMKNVFRDTRQRVSITTDIWTAPTTRWSYMVVTAHFIDAGWRLRKLIIGFKKVDSHTGSAISEVLMQCLKEWGIEKVFTITVDNATANTLALSMFSEKFKGVGDDALVLGGEFLHVRCAAHIINLVVRDGLKEVDKSVLAVRNAIQYVRSSTSRLQSFKRQVEGGSNVSRGSLPIDCLTRWNSTYLMLKRAQKFKSTFEKLKAEDKLYNDYFLDADKDGYARVGPPTARDWEEIDRLVKFLVIFYHSTLVVSASSKVNAHQLYAEICTIEKNLVRLCSCSDENMRSKATIMRAKFEKYWAGLREINIMLIIASVFDPRNKTQFAQLCFDQLYGKDSVVAKGLTDALHELLYRMFDEYRSRHATRQSSAPATSSQSAGYSLQSQAIIVDEDCLGYERMDFVYKEMVNERGLHDLSNEVELYLKESVENPKLFEGTEYDVLGWWRINSTRFPVLAEMARDVLGMQVSSVASESAFSTSGRILDPYRSCLSHFTLEVLMCTEQWLKSELLISDQGVATISDLLADIELQDSLQMGM